MYIEVFKGKGKQPWRWHFRNGNKITACGEGHGSAGNAIRAAHGVVRATIKAATSLHLDVTFSREWSERKQCFVVRWWTSQ